MECKKCGYELPNDSLFCNKCGTKTLQKEPSSFTNKLNRKLIVIILIFIIGVLIVLFNASSPVNRFKSTLNNNKYLEATTIYDTKIKGNLEKEEAVIEYLMSIIEAVKKDFISEKIEYNYALTRLETISKTKLIQSVVNSALSEINRINNSRTAFKKGNEFLTAGNYKDAFIELNKVIKEDENYNKAQEMINDSIVQYKSSIIAESESEAHEGEYSKAIALLNQALVILPNDSDISAKKAVLEKLSEEKKVAERTKKMDELKEIQEVSVLSSRVVRTGSYYDFFHIEITVRNNTDKVIKDYVVGWLAYDNNGYPINLDSRNFIESGSAKAVNIQPGKTYGSGKGWSILSNGEDAKKILACVKEVEYYNGSKWINPYYDLWLEEHMGKPLN